MEHGIGMGTRGRRGIIAAWMRPPAWGLLAAMLGACHAPPSPGTAPALAEPAVFSTWPRVANEPIRISQVLSMMCIGNRTADHMSAIAGSSNGDRSIVVRVSPEAMAAYREGRPLPPGAVVVKEKYDDPSASGPLRAYGVMIKRAAGYDPRGGDWEYAFVTLASTPMVTRGRLPACAACHAAARERDHLFRSHTGDAR